jgi:hypothetical protein
MVGRGKEQTNTLRIQTPVRQVVLLAGVHAIDSPAESVIADAVHLV